MKNILILTYNFPPDGGPAVQRVVKFIKYIANFGFRAIVLTSKHKRETTDETLLKDIPGDTLVYQTLDYGNYCPGELRNKLLKNFFVPDKQRFWGYSALKIIDNIVRDNKIDLIFSTSPPHSVHLLASKIKNKLNLPWVADFRDEWTKNPGLVDLKYIAKNKQLEEMVFRNADHIVVCTKTAENHFNQMYSPENISVVMNGYDSEDFISISDYKSGITNNDECLNILYYGRLNNLHSIDNLLQAMNELKREKHVDPNYIPIKIKVIGNNQKSQWLKKYSDIAEDVDFIDYKPHKDCLEYALSSDILLLLATGMKETEFFPAKVFEYIKLRKPILGIITKYGELSSFLETYGNSLFAIEGDIDNLKQSLLKLMILKKYNGLLVSGNDDFIESFDRKKQAEKLAGIFALYCQ